MQQIKEALRASLEKNGHTLQEFEQALATINTAEGILKCAELMKSAAGEAGDYTIATLLGKGLNGLGSTLGAIPGAIGSVANLAGTGAIMAGTGAGLGAYGLKKHLEGQDKSLDRRRMDGDRLEMLMKRLGAEHGLK